MKLTPPRFALASLLALVSACNTDPQVYFCTVGTEFPCTCPDGTESIATCTEAGQVGACPCDPSTDTAFDIDVQPGDVPDTGDDVAGDTVEDAEPSDAAADVEPDAADAAEDSSEDASGDPVDTAPDVFEDTARDVVEDAAPDTVEDTEPDAIDDAVEDPSPDVVDAAPDAEPDLVEDAEPDADAGTGGVGCEEVFSDPYVGCEFWAADLPVYDDPFSGGPELDWGVHIISPFSERFTATFEVYEPGVAAPATVVESFGQTVTMPRLDLGDTGVSSRSVRIVTDTPVSIIQRNPLLADDVSAGASALLPVRSLGTAYTGVALPAGRYIEIIPGFEPQRAFISIIATAPGTTDVRVTPTIDVQDGGAFVDWFAGEERSVALEQGEVLNLAFVSPLDALEDPTGTLIESSAPVSVFGGHEQATVGGTTDPDACCADRVEEQVVPHSMFGTEYILAHSPRRGSEEDVWTVVAGPTSATLSTVPSVAGLDGVVLEPHGMARVAWPNSVRLSSTAPVLVARSTIGGSSPAIAEPIGDPSLTLIRPNSRFTPNLRSHLQTGFSSASVTIVAEEGSTVSMGGELLHTLSFGGFDIYWAELDPGPVIITSDGPMGGTLTAFGETSAVEHPLVSATRD